MARPVIASAHASTLASDLAKKLGADPLRIALSHYADGEVHITLHGTEGSSPILVHEFTFDGSSINQQLLEMLLCIQTLGVQTVVLPYMPYARHDAPLGTLAVFAQLLASVGVKQIITSDVHAPAATKKLALPVHNISLAPLWAECVLSVAGSKNVDRSDIVIASPDAGGITRAQSVAKLVGCSAVHVEKTRSEKNITKAGALSGDVKSKTVFLLDDIVATAGTAVGAKKVLVGAGARSVFACFSHGVFAQDALVKLKKAKFSEIFVSDTIISAREYEGITSVPAHKFIADEVAKFLK